MRWYEGNIAEAIQKSRQEGSVFGVAIFGDDDNSKVLEESLNSDDAQAALSAGKFVCIRITADSEEHRQFSQIYTNAASPSIFLIGEKGATLEVLSTMDSKTLKEKLQSAWNRHSASVPAVASAIQPSASSKSGSSSSTNTAQALIQANEVVKTAENEANQTDLSLEEKVLRAQKLAAAKRQQKLAEEAEDLKRKERERREAGKGMAELKRWQTEQEAKQLVDERKKEKQEEAELRKRVKEQIAQDRAARNARSNVSFLTEGPHSSEDPAAVSPSTRPTGMTTSAVSRDYSGQARLQFRLPSGSSISQAFEPEVTLGDVRTFLINNNHVPFRQFTISVAYPRRQFSSTDYTTNLRDLGLVPSAALLILPVSGGISVPRMTGSGIGDWVNLILGYIMIPFTFIFALIQRALPSSSPSTSAPPGPGRPQQRPPASTSQPRPSTSGTPLGRTPSANSEGDSAQSDVRNRKGKSGETKKGQDGNIHRLRNHEGDSDEEKATWNGNSTQQM